MDPNGDSSIIFPMDPLVPHSFSTHFLSHIVAFADNSRYLYVPGSLALQEAFNCFSKFAGSLFIWFASGSNSNIDHIGKHDGSYPRNRKCDAQLKRTISQGQKFKGVFGNCTCEGKWGMPLILGKISRFSMKHLYMEAEQLCSLSPLSLAAALVPPFNNVCQGVLAVPLEAGEVAKQRCMSQRPCGIENDRCNDISFQSLSWTGHAVEPRTGIEFPTILENTVAAENNSSFTSEVLVGTGSRIMKIIRIKSLKVYAFGFYVHPFDVCEKLGPKYASLPVCELNKSRDFYADLLREDINMTVRLVVSCNGIKINTVKDAFEKALRTRLLKTNPDTDYTCLQRFGSIFPKDIPLHAGTTINFRRTADGCFITEIGDNQLGTVQSKELCRAFFDMYIGDIPVCEQTKEQIGENVANIMRRC
ncbi:hypothetical protein ACH5RR_039957 [Cinchona calisaya]|uniref:Chalcone isomerase domain-containing protein n=1 Tax=Cinchona calisaya TaxID=153742 RepID=A0ABD2XZT5_9GENT